MNIQTFLKQNNVPAQEGGKNWQQGWTQVNCPYCQDSGYHGGIHLTGLYFNCWRCGWKPLDKILSDLIGININDVRRMISGLTKSKSKKEKKKGGAENIVFPENCHNLQSKHKKYLKKRRYDPDRLSEEWGIQGTGPIGNYKFRVIIPINYQDEMVSYMGRDITGRQSLKYKACAENLEVIPYKHIVYGIDKIPNKTCLIVEGILDVWRLGFGAVSTFGTTWTKSQALLISNHCDNAFIMYDAERPAQEKANKLGLYLDSLGVNTEMLELPSGDPDDLTVLEAKKIMKIIK